MGNKTVTIIPTYNAKKSIIRLIKDVFGYLPDTKVIVVDDSSPDGTAKELRSHFAGDSRITIIVRERKGGRGSAVIEGFRQGLRDRAIRLFIEMDSDFAHSPSDLPRLIKKAQVCDVVVASRYRLHSHIAKWSLKRRLISRFANLWIKYMLGFSLTDNTNGFRCYKRHVLETINLNLISAKGFIVLTEIAYQIYKKGFIFGEIPIDFVPVDLNRSNLNLKEIREAFFTVLRLRLLNNFEFRKRKNKVPSRL